MQQPIHPATHPTTYFGHKYWPKVPATDLSPPDGGSYVGADRAEAPGAKQTAHQRDTEKSLPERL